MTDEEFKNLQSIFPQIISLERCMELTTARLLAFYKKHRRAVRHTEWESDHKRWFETDDDVDARIKQVKHLSDYFESIKCILDSRENVQ